MPHSAQVEQWLEQVERAVAARCPPVLRPFVLEDFGVAEPVATTEPAAAPDATVELRIEFGRTTLATAEVEQLESGCVVPLGRPASEPVDLLCNGRLIGRGELLVMNEQICVRVTQLPAEESSR